MSGIPHTISISKSGEKHEQIHAATMFKILMALFTRQNQFTEQEQWGKNKEFSGTRSGKRFCEEVVQQNIADNEH